MPMQLEYQATPDCKLTVEVKDLKQTFSFVSQCQEIFGNKKCGHCGSTHLKLSHRTPGEFDYYSVECQDCKYELKFGQAKTGKLFPKGWEAPHHANGRGDREYSQDREPVTTGGDSGAGKLPWE